MKKLSLFSAAALTALGSVSVVHAADSHDVNVEATVNAVCRFVAPGPTTLPIGNAGAGVIDPSLTTDATGQATVQYRCTKGTTASVAAGNGANHDGTNRNITNGADSMPYSLALTGQAQEGTGFAAGQELDLVLDAVIAAADYQNVSAGDYADTVTLTVTP